MDTAGMAPGRPEEYNENSESYIRSGGQDLNLDFPNTKQERDDDVHRSV